jgi:hypothetical protein
MYPKNLKKKDIAGKEPIWSGSRWFQDLASRDDRSSIF